MARKSRKTATHIEIKEQVTEAQKERTIKAGGYVRVSSDQNDNNSIETQILMIKQYVKDHPSLELVDIYSDDGYSGTNFVRPDFERLMRDIYTGKVECIIVKDLSRFGRNYIEAGYYLETVLPNLNVRFISINDRFDTAREEDRVGMALPIKNMVNAMYAIDVSKKIVKNVELHQKLGDAKYSTTTYGYLLNQDSSGFIADPVASRYVKLIFHWYLMGYSPDRIAERLNIAGVLPPGVYKAQVTSRRPKSKSGQWSSTVVRNILDNPTYIGAKVHGKQRTRLVDHVDHKRTDRSEWTIHYGNHEPIIDQKIYELAQEKLSRLSARCKENRINAAPLGEMFKNSLAKRVVCKDCGAVMQYIRKPQTKTRSGFVAAYYTCSDRKKAPCRNIVYEDYLKTIVLDQIKNLVRYFGDQKDGISALKGGRNEKSVLLSTEKKLIHMKKKEADLDDLILNLYKDLAKGIINEKEYKELNEHYLKEKEDVKDRIKDLNETVFKMRRQIDAFENLGTKIIGYLDDSVDSQTLIDELVERVYVSEDGSIEIVFKCNDIIENYMYLAGEKNEEYSNVS